MKITKNALIATRDAASPWQGNEAPKLVHVRFPGVGRVKGHVVDQDKGRVVNVVEVLEATIET